MSTDKPVNPFFTPRSWSIYEAFKVYLVGIILAPIRIVILLILLIVLNIFSRTALLGYNPFEKIIFKL
jgi:hypothetical protein